MKILQSTPFYPPHMGGVELHVYNLTLELELLGNNVNVITSNFPKSNSLDRNTIRLPILCDPWHVPICPSIFKYLKEIETDVVHMHTPPRFFPETTTFFYKFFKRGIPLVLTNHAPISERLVVTNHATSNRLFFERAAYIFHNRFIHRWIHKNAHRIIVQGEAMKTLFCSTIPKSESQNLLRKIRIIPNGVDHEVFDLKIYNTREVREKFGITEEKVIMFIGRLAKHKGIDHLLNAIRLIKRNLRDLFFIIVGDGLEKRHLEFLCRKLDLGSNVRFMGALPHKDIPPILSLASVLVHPSSYEGVPTAVLEAMAMRKPVVVTNAGCMPEVVQDQQTGLVVEMGNVLQLADAIFSILSDKKLASRMGQRGRRLIEERYSWNIVAKKHLKVYEEALLEMK